jgi:hypothetical protein
MDEARLLLGTGLLFGAFKYIGEEDKRLLTIELISNEALKTSGIEGEYLDHISIQSSIRRQFVFIIRPSQNLCCRSKNPYLSNFLMS